MPRRKQSTPPVASNWNPAQESFVSDDDERTAAPAASSTDQVRASQMCRCMKRPKALGKLFCDPCFQQLSKLWTTPASKEFGLCVQDGAL